VDSENPFLLAPASESSKANSAAAALAGVGLVAVVLAETRVGSDEALRCIDCGACNAVGDACPGAIEDEAGLVAAARAGDLRAFVGRAGLICTRCGICSSFCPVGLDLARIFAHAHAQAHDSLAHGRLAGNVVRDALRRGQVGGEFIEDALTGLGDR